MNLRLALSLSFLSFRPASGFTLGAAENGEPVPFREVTTRGYHFDSNYFDGGTSWNDDLFPTSKEVDAGRIAKVATTLKTRPLEWPSDRIANFQDCDLGAVTCCFAREGRQPLSADAANSKACAHDFAESPRSSHTKNGPTVYGGLDAYCVGFAWDEAADTVETVYKANTLFQISMVKGLWEKDLRGALPGAPMCGCVEKMPVVTHVECIKPSIEGDTVEYVPCSDGDNGLVEYYTGLFPGATEKIEALEKKIVDTCEEGVNTFLKERGYAMGTPPWWHASSDVWTPLEGNRFLYHPTITQDEFQEAYEASNTKIIRRVCALCKLSHKDVYYRRVADETELPEGFDLVETLTSSFKEENNQMGTHFNIYSTYEDALSRQNPWLFCNYSANKGFPSECGPTSQTTKQWSSKNGDTYGKTYAYYLEK